MSRSAIRRWVGSGLHGEHRQMCTTPRASACQNPGISTVWGQVEAAFVGATFWVVRHLLELSSFLCTRSVHHGQTARPPLHAAASARRWRWWAWAAWAALRQKCLLAAALGTCSCMTMTRWDHSSSHEKLCLCPGSLFLFVAMLPGQSCDVVLPTQSPWPKPSFCCPRT